VGWKKTIRKFEYGKRVNLKTYQVDTPLRRRVKFASLGAINVRRYLGDDISLRRCLRLDSFALSGQTYPSDRLERSDGYNTQLPIGMPRCDEGRNSLRSMEITCVAINGITISLRRGLRLNSFALSGQDYPSDRLERSVGLSKEKAILPCGRPDRYYQTKLKLFCQHGLYGLEFGFEGFYL